jgi:hypothetical protein
MYPGAEPYTSADCERFGGRAAEGDALRTLWENNQVTFLAGPAGIGKTSLLNAEVLPRFELNRPPPLLGRLSDRARIPIALLDGHNPYTLALLRSWSGFATRYLAQETIADYLRRHAEHHPDDKILAAIDQADDLFAGPEERQPERHQFLDQLVAALAEDTERRLHLLISIRSDMLDELSDFLGGGERFHLDPLRPDMARQAVERPGFFVAAAADELVATMRTQRFVTGRGEVQHGSDDHVEPALLQIACARLWDSLRAHYPRVVLREELTGDGEELVEAVLTSHYGSVIAAVAAVHGVEPGWLRAWLVDTLITGVGELATAAESAGAPASAMRVLEDRHLLRGHGGGTMGSRSYQLLSDRLVEPLRQVGDDVSHTEDPADCLLAAERALVIGQHELADKYARRVLSIAPGDAFYQRGAACSLLGDLAYERRELEEAERNYNDAILLLGAVTGTNRALADLYLAIARTYDLRDMPQDAFEHRATSLKWVPDFKLNEQLLTWMMNE